MQLTSQSKSLLYRVFTIASRITQASITELWRVIISPLIVTLFVVRHSNKLYLFRPNKCDTKKKK